ncbi:MAG: hypothetical protein BGO82_17195 [Devosia sp. 67-54]|uniref:hypothetical protein n=1 Tax=unclassified Devosia TaxID=196773 RepID=UPI00095C7261|nr:MULTISPECIES: hypothetical protein [unclassified Devosia]MBN9304110.1 hypothetical protein [Devosia sp.]OJX17945.1 MAG: hypothetical protein BGO82_17195 [Devosia sp. 67-54]
MAARKGEQILVALEAVLQAAVPALGRNTPLPEAIDQVLRLLDGPPAQQTEAYLNPPMYEFTMRPFVQIIVVNSDDAARDAAVDTLYQALAAAIAGITDLGGLITDIRPQPPSAAPRELFGMPGMSGAEFDIEIDYWSETTAG